MPLNRNGGTWEGGYVSVGARGQKTYVIERRVNGEKFHVSTRCHALRAALSHLDRFEKNARAYRPQGGEGDGALHITADMLLEFADWHRTARDNTAKYVSATARYLEHWLADLGGADWRQLSAHRDLKPALDARGPGERAPRIAALKIFFKWLRREKGYVIAAQDPTLDLTVPQSSPAKLRARQVVDESRVGEVLRALAGRERDFLLAKAVTGAHATEIRRLVRGDNARLDVLERAVEYAPTVIAVARFRHKSKRVVSHPIETRQLLEALLRLQKDCPPDRAVNDAIRTVCARLGLPPFTLGKMRHSFGTWHAERGEAKQAIADGLHHLSADTTESFYIDVMVPRPALPAVTFDLSEHVSEPSAVVEPARLPRER
jgi:integrase